MNRELCWEMVKHAEEKYRWHQDVYGVTGRYYNMKQMEHFQELKEIYETALKVHATESNMREAEKARKSIFIELLRAEIDKYGRISKADFNEWMQKEGYKYL